MTYADKCLLRAEYFLTGNAPMQLEFLCALDSRQLAKRLRKSIEALRKAESQMQGYTDGYFGKLADVLERDPE